MIATSNTSTIFENLACKDIWLLQNVADLKVSTPILGVVILLVCCLLSVPLAIAAYQMDPATAYYPPRSLGNLVLILGFSVGFTVFAAAALSRGFDKDMQELALTSDEVNSVEHFARLSRFKLLATIGFMIVFTHLAISYGDLNNRIGVDVYSHSDRVQAVVAADWPTGTYIFVGLTLLAIVGGTLLFTLYRQYSILSNTAAILALDLFRLERLSSIANPCVRLTLVLLSSVTLVSLLVIAGLGEDDVLGIIFVILLGFTPLIALFLRPIVRIRNNIRLLKATAIEELTNQLEHAGNLAVGETSDLISQRMFVESRWEWPVAQHLQKLVLFGLMPPTTWVLSAIVENMLY